MALDGSVGCSDGSENVIYCSGRFWHDLWIVLFGVG